MADLTGWAVDDDGQPVYSTWPIDDEEFGRADLLEVAEGARRGYGFALSAVDALAQDVRTLRQARELAARSADQTLPVGERLDASNALLDLLVDGAGMADNHNEPMRVPPSLRLPGTDPVWGADEPHVTDQEQIDSLIEQGALTKVIISAHDCDLYDAGPDGLGIDPRIPTSTPLYRLTPHTDT